MKHIYISACDKTGGIYHYTFDNGRLNLCEKVDLAVPMYTVCQNGRVYALTKYMNGEEGFGGILSFKLDGDFSLTDPTDVLSTNGVVPCHLCVQDDDIYVVNYVSGSLVKLPDVTVTHTGHSVHPTRQEKAHTHFVTTSPDQKYVLCTDLGLDTVFVYDRQLNFVSSAKVPDGSGPRHLCFNGRLLYCVNELSSDVCVFSFKNGELELLGTYTALPDYKGDNTAAAIRIYDGRLYISHRGADCITCYDIKGDTLELLWNSPCGGERPRDFDIVDGYIICTNEGGNVAVLKLGDDGAELISNEIEMPDPLCVMVI